MASREDQEGRGPSWWDVERRIEMLQTRYRCLVAFDVVPYKAGEFGKRAWQVNACAHDDRILANPPALVAGHQFKGNAGASTMAAAMFMALTKLEDRLEERAARASEQQAF